MKKIHKTIMTLVALFIATAMQANIVTIVSSPNGTIVPDKTSADAGETVTLTITPATGYKVTAENILVEKTGSADMAQAPSHRSPGFGNSVAVTPVSVDAVTGAGTYAFTMPVSNVEISATFKKLLTHSDITVADIAAQTYSGTAITPIVTVKDGSTTLTLGGDYSVSYDSNVNAGTATITIMALGDYYAGERTMTFTIAQKALTITANPQTITYGEDVATGTAQVTADGLVAGDALTGVTLTPSTLLATAAGTITPSAASSTKGISNYDVTYNTGTLTVNQKDITVSGITASNKEYDGNTTATINTGAAVFTGIVGSDVLTVSTTGTFDNKNAGTGKTVTLGTLTLGGASVANYQLAASGQQTTTTADITPKSITITPTSGQTKVYGSADPVLTYNLVELIGDDAFSGALSRDAGDQVSQYDITQGTLTAGSNYAITFTAGVKFSITPKSLTITAKNQTITYGEDVATGIDQVNITSGSLVASDELSGITISKTVTDAGSHPTGIMASNAVIKNGGTDNTANYLITYDAGQLTINKATLTVTVDNEEREVGTANPLFTINYSGYVNGEDESNLTQHATATCTATEESSVGTYPITLSGAEATNYAFVYVPGTLTVYGNIPFASSDWMTWYGSEDLTVDASKLETYVVTDVSTTAVTTSSTDGKLYANTPMLLKRKYSSTSNNRFDAASWTAPTGLSPAYIGGVSTFAGYTAGTVYVLAGSEFVRAKVTASSEFAPTKCFVYLTGMAGSRLSIITDDFATGVHADDIAVGKECDTWYTIEGRKLIKRPSRAGMYIHNGKKVVVK